MLDYIHISICLKGQKQPDFSRLQRRGMGWYGRRHWVHQRANSVKITYDENTGRLTLEGSIPYFWQNHNYTFGREQFITAINDICQTIGVDLWVASVVEFEFGAIMPVPKPPKEYIRNHRERERELLLYINPKHHGHLRRFEDKYVRLKLYDAGKNIKNKHGLSKRKALEQLGWDATGHYVKFEVHYKKPHITLNRGRDLQLADLVDPAWEKRFKDDLLAQYGRLLPARTLTAPQCRSDYSPADVALRKLVKMGINAGLTIQDIQDELYSDINNTTTAKLTKGDKDYRKSMVRKGLGKITLSEDSEWDLSGRLAAEIGRAL